MSGAADLIALSKMRRAEWLQEAAKIRESVPKLQLEVIKMHLGPGKPKPAEIADRFGIAPDEAAAILKAFKTFLSKKAY